MNTTTHRLLLLLMLFSFGFLQAKAQVQLEVVSIDPANYEEDVPVDKVIRISFNQPIKLLDMGDIIINGVPVDATWVTIEGNDLVITSAGLLRNFTYLVDIKPGAVAGLSDNTLVDEYTSVFYTERDHPIIIVDYDTLDFDTSVGIPSINVATFIGEQFSPGAISKIEVAISGANPEQFAAEEITLQETREHILTGEPMDVTYTPTEDGEHTALLTVTFTIAGQPTPFVLNIYLRGKARVVTSIDENAHTKEVVKEELYTLSGVRVAKGLANGIYIKKSFYDDGSSASEKVIVKE